MGNDESKKIALKAAKNENLINSDGERTNSADKSEVSTNKQEQALDASCEEPNENSAGARDLTDEELRTLKRSFQDGLSKIKNHPWNGEKDE